MPRQFPQEVSIPEAVHKDNAWQARLTSRTTLALVARLVGCLFGLLRARIALVARLTGPASAVPQLHRAEGQPVAGAVAPRSVMVRAAGTTAVALGCSRRRRWAARSCCAPAVAGGCPAHPSAHPTTPASTGSPWPAEPLFPACRARRSSLAPNCDGTTGYRARRYRGRWCP